MPKSNRKKLSSPESFQQAFNKHQNEFKNPKVENNSNQIRIELIGVDKKGKFKKERINLPRWYINAIEITFQSNQKETINLGELQRQMIEKSSSEEL